MKYMCSVAREFSVGEILDKGWLGPNRDKVEKSRIHLDEKDTYVVFVCFEEGDNVTQVKESCLRIEQLYQAADNGLKTISLIPFSHLSEYSMTDKDLIEFLMQKMHRVLVNKGIKTNMVSPNVANTFMAKWLLVDKFDGVKFGSSETSLKAALKSLIRAHGPQKVFRVLGELLTIRKRYSE